MSTHETEDREVLSEVHTYNRFQVIDKSEYAITRFHVCFNCKHERASNLNHKCKRTIDSDDATDSEKFTSKNKKVKCTASEDTNEHVYDKDGDIILDRPKNPFLSCSEEISLDEKSLYCDNSELMYNGSDKDFEICYINITHSLATDLHCVGEQVWQGALLLCDYIIHYSEVFSGQSVVDLGAGTGLTSIIAALYASRVYCTDTGDNVLHLASQNIQNAQQGHSLYTELCPVLVKELDWSKSLAAGKTSSSYSLTEDDVADIKHSPILIAADVIYDNDITDVFFNTVKQLMSEGCSKILFLALEKRLVFTIEDLAVTSPAYDYFRHHIDSLSIKGDNSSVVFTVERLTTDFPQYFKYQRTQQMEMWKITSLHDACVDI